MTYEKLATESSMEERDHRCHVHPHVILESGGTRDLSGKVHTFSRPCPECIRDAVENECKCEVACER